MSLHPAADSTMHLSPSLSTAARRFGPAYEIKFLLSAAQALEVEERLNGTLAPDPHSDPALGGMYAITNLICDTPDFAVFFRDSAVRFRKYRIRRYGDADAVFLERKRSRAGRVRKFRTPATLAHLPALASGSASDLASEWFVREVQAMDLRPVCRISYRRRALCSASPDGPVRVTFDREIRGSLAGGWSLDHARSELPLLPQFVICEFKFHQAMPSPLRAIVAALQLNATGISKYRTCARAFAADLALDLSRDSRGDTVPEVNRA